VSDEAERPPCPNGNFGGYKKVATHPLAIGSPAKLFAIADLYECCICGERIYRVTREGEYEHVDPNAEIDIGGDLDGK